MHLNSSCVFEIFFTFVSSLFVNQNVVLNSHINNRSATDILQVIFTIFCIDHLLMYVFVNMCKIFIFFQ